MRLTVLSFATALAFCNAPWLVVPSESLAQTRTDYVCWAERPNMCSSDYTDAFFRCGTGGHSGFNPDFVCQQTCAATRGPRCKVTPAGGGGGGACGWREAKIECFN